MPPSGLCVTQLYVTRNFGATWAFTLGSVQQANWADAGLDREPEGTMLAISSDLTFMTTKDYFNTTDFTLTKAYIFVFYKRNTLIARVLFPHRFYLPFSFVLDTRSRLATAAVLSSGPAWMARFITVLCFPNRDLASKRRQASSHLSRYHHHLISDRARCLEIYDLGLGRRWGLCKR